MVTPFFANVKTGNSRDGEIEKLARQLAIIHNVKPLETIREYHSTLLMEWCHSPLTPRSSKT